MALPTFLVIGASKSGTTSLHYYLDAHPEIFMSSPKELRFFDRTRRYRRGLDFYESFFDGTEARQRGETSPTYWYRGITFNKDGGYRWNPEDDVASRVAKCCPNIRIVLSLRNPVDRSYSQYWKNVAQGRETASTFRRALQLELSGARKHTRSPLCWIYKNRIATHISRWLELFDGSQIHVEVFEDWIDDPGRALDAIADFLGVAPQETWERAGVVKNPSISPRSRAINYIVQNCLHYPGVRHLNKLMNLSPGYPDMDGQTRRLAEDVFGDVIAEAEELLDRDLSVWTGADDSGDP